MGRRINGALLLFSGLALFFSPFYFSREESPTRTILSQREGEGWEIMGAYIPPHRVVVYQEGNTISTLVISDDVFARYDTNKTDRLDLGELGRLLSDKR